MEVGAESFQPSLTVEEAPEGHVIHGVVEANPEQIAVEVQAHRVTVTATRSLRRAAGDVAFHDRTAAHFWQTFTFPYVVDPRRLGARYDRG